MKKLSIAVCSIGLLFVIFNSRIVVASEATDSVLAKIHDELVEIRKNQEALKNQIVALEKKVNSQPKSQPRNRDLDNVTVSIEGDPVMGDENAKLVLMEFSDYQCPFCGRHVKNTLPKIKEEFVQSGTIKYVFKDLPLERIHPQAVLAAKGANCAGEQGKYWEMHDELFANPKSIEPLNAHAEKLELDIALFESCVKDERMEKEVRADLSDARTIGVRSTPTFVFGTQKEDGSINGIRLVRGAASFQTFKNEIETLLKKVSKGE